MEIWIAIAGIIVVLVIMGVVQWRFMDRMDGLEYKQQYKVNYVQSDYDVVLSLKEVRSALDLKIQALTDVTHRPEAKEVI